MSNYEQPDYTVVAEFKGYEVRRYEAYLAAETTVYGDFDSTGSTAFRRLAGFIFGRNTQQLRMNMTVPVTREQAGIDEYRYRFVMEKAYAESDLPRPIDDSVEVVQIEAGYFAAVRYRGRRNEQRYRRVEKEMRLALERDGITIAGTSVSAVYNGPLTPPALRRNEVLIPIAWDDSQAA